MTPDELRSIPLPPRWFAVDAEHAHGLEEQLAREVRPGNPAHGRRLAAVLKSDTNDDVVFVEEDPTEAGAGLPVWWLIHLTWGTPVDARWPVAVRINVPEDLRDEDG